MIKYHFLSAQGPHQVIMSSSTTTNPSQEQHYSREGFGDLLPEDFFPGRHHVICQRGKECYEHSEYRALISFACLPSVGVRCDD